MATSGNPRAAVAEFDRMEVEHAAKLDDRLRYRIYANRGHAWLEAEEPLRAAEQYGVAQRLRSPDDRDGLWLGCVAAEFSGRSGEALALTDALVLAHPEFDRAWSSWLRSRAAETDPRTARRRVPRKLRREADVASALSSLHRRAGAWRGAVAYARSALRDAPGRAAAMAMLGSVLLDRSLRTATFNVPRGLQVTSASTVHEAIDLLTQAIEVGKRGETTHSLAVCLINRSSAHRLLGDVQSADDDVREVYRLFPSDPIAVARFASLLERTGDTAGVIRVVESARAAGDDPGSQFFLSLALRRRGGAGDGDHAISILQKLLSRGSQALGDSFSDAVGLLCDLLVESDRRPEAIETLTSLPAGSMPEPLRSARLAELAVFDQETGRLHERIAQLRRIRVTLDRREAIAGEIEAIQKEVLQVDKALAQQFKTISFERAGDLLADGMNTYLNAITEIKPKTWSQTEVVVVLRERTFAIKIGQGSWRSKLGATLTLLFLISYHYALMTLTAKRGCHFPGFCALDFPAELNGTSVTDSENFVLAPFVQLMHAATEPKRQLIAAGSSFHGLEGANRIELTKVWVDRPQ